jgi:hypothetical protein
MIILCFLGCDYEYPNLLRERAAQQDLSATLMRSIP